MRDQENGRARFSPQPQELVAHQQPRLLVQGAERLVEEDEPGLLHERAGNAYALAHAARELCGIGSAKIGESHERDGVVDAGERLVGGDARVFQTERDVVVHGQPRKARVLLEHDADTVGNAAFDSGAFEYDGARRGPGKSCDHVEQRRLPATRRADNGEKFAASEREVERPERLDIRACAASFIYACDRQEDDMRITALRARHCGAHFVGLLLRSAGRNDSSISLDQSTSPLTAPTNFCARIMLFIVSSFRSPGPQ